MELDPLVFESCHSTWLFDTEHLRFRRILKGVATKEHPVVTEWRPYFALEFDPRSETFTVLLNSDGSRRLCSWRHTHECTECGGHETAELSLDELARTIHGGG
jgi:hypothetical protein